MRILTIEETRQLSIFDLLGKVRAPTLSVMLVILAAAIAWLGGLAFLAPYRPNEVWALLSWMGPAQNVYYFCLAAAISSSALLFAFGKRSGGALMATIAAYLGAFWGSSVLHGLYDPDMNFPFTDTQDGVDFAIARLWLGIPALLFLGLAALMFWRRTDELRPHLGFGDWALTARETSTKEKMLPYWRRLAIGFVIVAVVLALILQSLVQFEPLTSGRLFAVFPAILLAALTNSIVEELIYRGFLQPAFMRVAGVGLGLWVSSFFFGLCHWGLSFGVLAALPVSILIGLGSVVWGKAAYETRGLAWPIAAHFLIDVGIMSAYFV